MINMPLAFCPPWPDQENKASQGQEEDGDDASVIHCDWMIILTIDNALPLSRVTFIWA